MSAWTWQVEARIPGDRFSWKRLVDKLPHDKATDAAAEYAERYPRWQVRIHCPDTGEIQHVEKGRAA